MKPPVIPLISFKTTMKFYLTAKKLAEPNKRKPKRDNMPQVKKC
jgi:hypothetical protein